MNLIKVVRFTVRIYIYIYVCLSIDFNEVSFGIHKGVGRVVNQAATPSSGHMYFSRNAKWVIGKLPGVSPGMQTLDSVVVGSEVKKTARPKERQKERRPAEEAHGTACFVLCTVSTLLYNSMVEGARLKH